MTREGMTLGTPEYMAPEQILTNGKPGPGADIYSLGMLMYECVAGAPAFTATTTAAILRGHISEPVVPPSHRRGEADSTGARGGDPQVPREGPEEPVQLGEELAAALRAERAVELVTPRFKVQREKRPSRALQMLPAFAMAAAAAALHFAPKPRASREGVTGTRRRRGPNAPAPAPQPGTPSTPRRLHPRPHLR